MSQPRLYRLHLMEGTYEPEASRKEKHVAVLDFSAGPGLRATEGQLDALVTSLAYAAGARGAKTLKYRLAVHDAETGEFVCSWPATTWHVEP
jgi:hypothetical protein